MTDVFPWLRLVSAEREGGTHGVSRSRARETATTVGRSGGSEAQSGTGGGIEGATRAVLPPIGNVASAPHPGQCRARSDGEFLRQCDFLSRSRAVLRDDSSVLLTFGNVLSVLSLRARAGRTETERERDTEGKRRKKEESRSSPWKEKKEKRYSVSFPRILPISLKFHARIRPHGSFRLQEEFVTSRSRYALSHHRHRFPTRRAYSRRTGEGIREGEVGFLGKERTRHGNAARGSGGGGGG